MRADRPAPADVLSLGLPLAALLAVQAFAPAAQRLPAGTARLDLVAAWAAAQPGGLAGAPWSLAAPGRLQLGLLLRAADALGGGPVLDAAQLVLLVLAAVQAVLLWLLLRRLGCGRVAAGLAAAVLGVAPAAVVAHTGVSTAAVGGVWLLAAALLAGRARVVPRALAGVAAMLAVVSAPLAVVPVAVGAAVVLRRLPWRATAIGAGIAAAALAAAAAALSALPATAAGARFAAVAAPAPSAGAGAPVAWATADPLGLLVAVVALAVCARHRTSRGLPVTAALLLVASVWPAGANAVGPLVLLLLVAACAIGLVAQRAAVALVDPVFRRSLVGSGWLTGVAALLLVGVVVALTGLPRLDAGTAGRADRAQRWLTEGSEDPSTAAPSTSPSSSSSSGSVAAPTPTEPSDAAERQAAAERRSTGRQLADNPRITMSDEDRALLRSGAVDARVALVLAQLAASHRIAVASFGVQRGDASGIRTSVVISAVDGDRVPADVSRTGDLLRFLSALRDDFAARTIDVTRQGVVAAFIPDPSWLPSS